MGLFTRNKEDKEDMSLYKIKELIDNTLGDRIMVFDMGKDLPKWRLKPMLTESRLKLINVIAKEKPESVGELGRITGRMTESVSRDLRYLKKLGIVKSEGIGHIRKPIVDKDIILFVYRINR